MLIEFSVTNYKVFKEKATLSMAASNYDKLFRNAENIRYHEKFDLRLLTSSVIYGANASGKSTFINAMEFMRFFGMHSASKTQAGDRIGVTPFQLSTESENSPSEFEFVFLHKDVIYRYGFSVTEEKVIFEWLFLREHKKEIPIFERKPWNIEFHAKRFPIGKLLINKSALRENAALLSLAGQFNDPTALRVFEIFDLTRVISGDEDLYYRGYTSSLIDKPDKKKQILEFLRAADFSITDLNNQEFDEKLNPDYFPELKPIIHREAAESGTLDDHTRKLVLIETLMSHKKFDSLRKHCGDVPFPSFWESKGTWHFLMLSGPILDTLKHGRTLVIDELDAHLHPELTEKIAALFNSPKTNPNNAQLIFNTHNTNLLNSELFRRDQIWFTERNRLGAATLYSLNDFKSDTAGRKGVRKDENFEENYLRGRYGAVPYLLDFENFTIPKQQSLIDESQ